MTKLKRYESPHQHTDMVECGDGDWVRYDDIKRLLADAARYRYLRTCYKSPPWDGNYDYGFTSAEEVDAQIDRERNA